MGARAPQPEPSGRETMRRIWAEDARADRLAAEAKKRDRGDAHGRGSAAADASPRRRDYGLVSMQQHRIRERQPPTCCARIGGRARSANARTRGVASWTPRCDACSMRICAGGYARSSTPRERVVSRGRAAHDARRWKPACPIDRSGATLPSPRGAPSCSTRSSALERVRVSVAAARRDERAAAGGGGAPRVHPRRECGARGGGRPGAGVEEIGQQRKERELELAMLHRARAKPNS